jgi:hypothetical protein
MIRHYCDLCDDLVKSRNFLSTIEIHGIEDFEIYNRNDSSKWRIGLTAEICLSCRVKIIETIEAIQKKTK